MIRSSLRFRFHIRSGTSSKFVSLVLVLSLFFTGCSSGFHMGTSDPTSKPNPRDYISAGDQVRLELRNDTHVDGVVQAIRPDSVTIDGVTVAWSDVEVIKKTDSTPAILVFAGVVVGSVLLAAALVSIAFSSFPGD
jgi:PBP1b-binding outer membrane lipoprotein LpoB